MRRLFRRALNLAAAVSAVLFVAFTALGLRSYVVSDLVWVWKPRPDWPGRSELLLASGRGRVYLRTTWTVYSTDDDIPRGRLAPLFQYERHPAADSSKHLSGPTCCRRWYRPVQAGDVARLFRQGEAGGWLIRFPDWLPMAVTLSLPALWAIRASRGAGRKTPGLCPACGYDLRATPDRCPECGAVLSTKGATV